MARVLHPLLGTDFRCLAQPFFLSGVDFVLAAGNRPQHRILCEFRPRHRADFGAVLVAVAQLARDLGLVSLTKLVPDRTKVRAYASQRKAISFGRLQQ